MRKSRGKLWMHPKYGKTIFRGSYVLAKGDRVFQLVAVTGSRKPISLESWQLAREVGWKLV